MANLFERTKISVMAKQQRDRRDERYAAAVTSEVATVVSAKAVAINGQIYRATVPGGVAGDTVTVVNQGGGAALYTAANASVVGSNGGGAAVGGSTGGAAMTQHDMTGSYHAASGLTTGQVIKATSPTTFGWRTLAVGELAPGSAQYQIPVTGATPFTLAYVALGSLNGDGLAFSGGQFVVDSSIARSAIAITGTGALGGGGDLTANRAISLNTPGTLTATSTNSSATNHTHTIDSTIARSAIQVTGTGALGGGGNLTADRTISLNTPGTLTVATSNSSATNHTHAITSNSAPGAAASLLASDGTGKLTLPLFVATTNVTTPVLTSSAALALTTSGGDISLDASTDIITIGASNTLKSTNYASQTTGWGIDYTGGADFRYVYADELHAKTFIADLEQALAGGQIISKSVAVLAVNFTVPAAGATATLRVKDLPSAANMAVFQSGDIVRLRSFSRASGALTIGNCWGVVTSYTDQSDGTQTWTFTRSTSTNAGSITAGTVINADSIVLDYGTTGNGFYEVNAIDGAYAANSPYWQIATWTSHPATGTTVNVRGGKLTGITSTANEYGLFAGTGTGASDSYLRLSSYTQESNNLSSTWKTGGSTFLSIDATNGVQIESINSLTSSNQRAYSFTIAGAESGGLYHYYNSTYTEAVMMLNQLSASRNNNIFVQTESDSGKNSRIYLEAKETTQATAYIDLQADVGGNVSEIQMGAYTISAYTSQILVKYANGSGGDGFASAPVYSFVDDTNTGIYRSAADTLDLSTGGVSRATINNTSFAVHQNNVYAGGIIESGQAQVSGNLSRFTGRNGTSSSVSLSAHSWGYSGGMAVNAYFASAAASYVASGAFKYLGAQYTGNVTKAGLLAFDGNSNLWAFYTSEAGLASGANITTWTKNLQLQDDGTLTLYGDLAWSSGGFASAWTTLTYNTGWGSYGSPYKAMSYCRIGDLVMVNGLVLRSSGTSTTIGTLPSGYRPTTNKVFDARANINSTVVSIRVDVDTSGNVTAVNLAGGDTVGFISLDNVQFRTNS